jgi:hypothetical protein
MATFLKRYQNCEYEQVWAELLAIGSSIRNEPLLSINNPSQCCSSEGIDADTIKSNFMAGKEAHIFCISSVCRRDI